MLLALGGALHLAPIDQTDFPLHRILDCGTGTGIWALEMGDLYPQAEVIGVDISPIQPHWVATNVKFELDDVSK